MSKTTKTAAAALWIQEADCILICAGAGLSHKSGSGECVYTSAADFQSKYPDFVAEESHSISTAYEAMSLFSDAHVPLGVKWGFWARHMENQRYRFTPSAGYASLLRMIEGKSSFIYTSNVDGCFERSGFDASTIYTPQGDWSHYQCLAPCAADSVFASRPMLDGVLHTLPDGVAAVPPAAIPTCPRCGGSTFGNVRGGSWFLHAPYEAQHARFLAWVDDIVNNPAQPKLVVIEVGAGFNTPTVTRFPMEALVRLLGDRAALVRVNPSDASVPCDLPRAVSLPSGWDVLDDLAGAVESLSGAARLATARAAEAAHLAEREGARAEAARAVPMWRRVEASLGHFHWRTFVEQLKR